MEEEEKNYSTNFMGIDYSLDHHNHQLHHQDQLMEQPRIGETFTADSNEIIDYMLNNPQQHQQQQQQQQQQHMSITYGTPSSCFDNAHFHREGDVQNKNTIPEAKNKRKRPRTFKTTEEVESQRMTHIAIERNRRKQMNEHLKVLRSLMPGSYVQRGDQASIVGGAIEFVRELEQLVQCLDSQKTRRLHGDQGSSMLIQQQQQQPLFPAMSLSEDRIELSGYDMNRVLLEETAESKSSLADVEVKLLGFDAMIKIMSKTRPGQLVKTIAALQDLNLNLIHTNITTVEQTVLYSFNVKIANESRFSSAEDIASSVQQIFSFIHYHSNEI